MSQYMNFYVRKNDDFVLIYECNRMEVLHTCLCNEVPYGKIKRLTKDVIQAGINNVEKILKDHKNERKVTKKLLKQAIKSGDAEFAEEIRVNLQDLEMQIDFTNYAYYTLFFLRNIVEDDVLLYGGEEVYDPTVEDIDI